MKSRVNDFQAEEQSHQFFSEKKKQKKKQFFLQNTVRFSLQTAKQLGGKGKRKKKSEGITLGRKHEFHSYNRFMEIII